MAITSEEMAASVTVSEAAETATAVEKSMEKKDRLVKISYLVAGLLGLASLFGFMRWYEGAFAVSSGLDAFSPEYRLYWLNLLYAELSLLPVLFTALVVYLWRTRDRDLAALHPRTEVKRIFCLVICLMCYAFALYWGLSFFTEQGGVWHQIMMRDTNFTPSHIVRTYLSYPVFVIVGMGAFMYARTRLPLFAKGHSLAFLLATVGPFMIIPNVGFSEWGHTYWFMEELFVGPMNYGYVIFGWFTLGLMGVLTQILGRCREIWGDLVKDCT